MFFHEIIHGELSPIIHCIRFGLSLVLLFHMLHVLKSSIIMGRLLCARDRANRWRICGKSCGESEQTVDSLPASVMVKAFDSKLCVPVLRFSSDVRWVCTAD